MKPNFDLSSSEAEKAAQKLWKQFNRHNEEAFWPQYEGLLATHRVAKVRKTNHTVIQEESPSSLLVKNQAFKPTPEYYLYSSLVVMAYLAITALLVISVMQSEIPLVENQTIMLALSGYLAVFLFTFNFTLGFNIFKTDSQYLLVYRPFFFAHSHEKWDDIASIVIEKDLSGEGGIKQRLILRTFEQKTRKYNYPLSPESHQLFFEFLKAKIPNTQYKIKGQTLIK